MNANQFDKEEIKLHNTQAMVAPENVHTPTTFDFF